MDWHNWRNRSQNHTEDNSEPERQSNNGPIISPCKSECNKLTYLLTDVGAFSCAAMVSLALHELFDNQWDRKFKLQCISLLIEHLNVKKEVESTLLNLSEDVGNQCSCDYKEILLAQPGVCGKPIVIIEDLLHFSVREGKYDARMRVLIQYLSTLLNVPVEVVDFYEDSFAAFLCHSATEVTDKVREENKNRTGKKKLKRYALIGLTALGGGALVGLTGGLAAPLLVAGVEAVVGAGSIALLGSTVGTAIIGSFFGVAGAGLTGFKMKKRVGEVEEFAFGVLTGDPLSNPGLHVTIAIAGWLSDDEPDNFIKPWQNLHNSKEQYYLRYESKYLMELGKAMGYFLNFAASMAAQEVLKCTVLSGVIAAIGWPATLLTLSSVIDNPWGVCCRRSAEVGKQLAEVLLLREQGQRPVTLIGYSLGARVIYYCLREMSSRDDCEGIIQDAILLGTPVTGSEADWNKLTRVISGKIVNGYSKRDMLLKFVYRTLSMKAAVAGLQAISINDRRIVNVDLTELVQGHGDYSTKIDEILEMVHVRTLKNSLTTFASLMKKSSSDNSQIFAKAKNSLSSFRRSKSEEILNVLQSGQLKFNM